MRTRGPSLGIASFLHPRGQAIGAERGESIGSGRNGQSKIMSQTGRSILLLWSGTKSEFEIRKTGSAARFTVISLRIAFSLNIVSVAALDFLLASANAR